MVSLGRGNSPFYYRGDIVNEYELKIYNLLLENQDEKYGDFNSKIINIDRNKIIGVRMPIIRKISKEILKDKDFINGFLEIKKHEYYELDLMHMLLIVGLKDYNRVISELDSFLPHVNTWAITDSASPKVFLKHKDELVKKMDDWISSAHPFKIRYGIILLMKLYLEDDFKIEYMNKVRDIKSDDYYVNMARAWYIAEAVAKQRDYAIHLLESKSLDKFTQNKAISKARDSYKVSKEDKDYLKNLRK